MSFQSPAGLPGAKLGQMRPALFLVFDDMCSVLLKRCWNTQNGDLNLKQPDRLKKFHHFALITSARDLEMI